MGTELVSHLATEVVVVQRTADQRIHLGMVDPHGRYCGLGSECLGKAKLHDCGKLVAKLLIVVEFKRGEVGFGAVGLRGNPVAVVPLHQGRRRGLHRRAEPKSVRQLGSDAKANVPLAPTGAVHHGFLVGLGDATWVESRLGHRKAFLRTPVAPLDPHAERKFFAFNGERNRPRRDRLLTCKTHLPVGRHSVGIGGVLVASANFSEVAHVGYVCVVLSVGQKLFRAESVGLFHPTGHR